MVVSGFAFGGVSGCESQGLRFPALRPGLGSWVWSLGVSGPSTLDLGALDLGIEVVGHGSWVLSLESWVSGLWSSRLRYWFLGLLALLHRPYPPPALPLTPAMDLAHIARTSYGIAQSPPRDNGFATSPNKGLYVSDFI